MNSSHIDLLKRLHAIKHETKKIVVLDKWNTDYYNGSVELKERTIPVQVTVPDSESRVLALSAISNAHKMGDEYSTQALREAYRTNEDPLTRVAAGEALGYGHLRIIAHEFLMRVL